MQKLTLLEMVQSTLASMASDSVNSITDSDEALVVAEIAKDTYYEILSRDDWPFLKKAKTLDAYGNASYPTFLKSPVPVAYIRNVRYNCRTSTATFDSYREIDYLEPDSFLDKVYGRTSSNSNVTTITTPDGIKLYVYNNVAPTCYTSFDDEVLVFDAYDSAVDATLQSSKSTALVVEVPTWTQSDTFIPELPAQMFPMLLAEVKAAAHQYLKQQGSPTDAKRALRGSSMAKWSSNRVQDRQPRRGFGRN